MADTRFVSDKHLTFDSDLDLVHGNLNFKRDTTPYFALSFCERARVDKGHFWPHFQNNSYHVK